MTIMVKPPAARLDYSIDWGTAYLGDAAILASEWQLSPVHDGGLLLVDSAILGPVTLATVTGGRLGAIYDLTNRITLSSGESDERSLSIRVAAR